jgi:hypothetical protein
MANLARPRDHVDRFSRPVGAPRHVVPGQGPGLPSWGASSAGPMRRLESLV